MKQSLPIFMKSRDEFAQTVNGATHQTSLASTSTTRSGRSGNRYRCTAGIPAEVRLPQHRRQAATGVQLGSFGHQ